MSRIDDILNHSDSLGDETKSGSTPSSLSLKGSSNSSTSTFIGSLRDQDGKIHEPEQGQADRVKHEIEQHLEQRNEGQESAELSEEPENGTGESRSKKVTLPKTLPKAIVNKRLLNTKLVQIAIRRKALARDFQTGSQHTKLHSKSLEAGLRVKLTLAPDLVNLYNSLTPHTSRKKNLRVYNSDGTFGSEIKNETYLSDIHLRTKPVQLIDNNLVNLSVFSNKVLKAFSNKDKNPQKTGGGDISTFNSLNTAVHTLFGIDEYSLVRITRSTTNDFNGSVLLKFETAQPGELNLIDEEDFAEDLLHSLGKPNDDPSNIFIKKVIARPRYKSDMKIYLIPKNVNTSLYVDKRMFERDLINGVVTLDFPFYKNILCAFEFQEVVESVKQLVKKFSSSPTSEELENRALTRPKLEAHSYASAPVDPFRNASSSNQSIQTALPPIVLPRIGSSTSMSNESRPTLPLPASLEKKE